MATQPRMDAPSSSDGISPRLFRSIADIVYAEAGITLPPSKQTMVSGRLRRRMRTLGFATLNDYCEFVCDPNVDRDEIEHLINAVTTNKTDFFREPRHFDYLRENILPELQQRGQRMVRCWSAAASTGAEPYTLAMVLDNYALANSGPDYRVIATDLDTEVLQTAIKGIYPRDQMAPVPKDLRARYVLDARDPARGEVRIVPKLRKKISFGRLNLMDRHYPVGDKLDVIFCRNVLIYFDKETQYAVISRLIEKLSSGGHLILGHSETIPAADFGLTTVGSTVFRKG